jgi:hypothetical protein
MFVFAPLSLLFVPIVSAVNIKWQRYNMIKYYSKPHKSWNPSKAVVVYTRFYVLSIIFVGLPTLIYFFSSSSLPKSCALQDFSNKLCLPHTLTSDNVCDLDPSSMYYTEPSSTAVNVTRGSQTRLCPQFSSNNQYPKCLCESACGIFIEDRHLLCFVFFNLYPRTPKVLL